MSETVELKDINVMFWGVTHGLMVYPDSFKATLPEKVPLTVDFREDVEHTIGEASNFVLKENGLYCDITVPRALLGALRGAAAPALVGDVTDNKELKDATLRAVSLTYLHVDRSLQTNISEALRAWMERTSEQKDSTGVPDSGQEQKE